MDVAEQATAETLAAEGSRMMRLLYLAWDVAIVGAICTGLILITMEVLAVNG